MLVQVFANPEIVNQDDLARLKQALSQFVTAALHCNTRKGRLTPDSASCVGTLHDFANWSYADAHITIDAFRTTELESSLSFRVELIRLAMEEFFPHLRVKIKISLHNNREWYRMSKRPVFNGDMSMEAAKSRFRVTLEA